MYVVVYMLGAVISFLAGFVMAVYKFIPIQNASGMVIGYRIAKIPANVFIQYVAAYTNYKPVFDVEGNVEGFSYQRVQRTPTETEDPTPAT